MDRERSGEDLFAHVELGAQIADLKLDLGRNEAMLKVLIDILVAKGVFRVEELQQRIRGA